MAAKGNRAALEKLAIESSRTHNEESKAKPQKRRRNISALSTSWGGRDCDFYFRWAEAEIGFKAQAMEAPAQTKTIGRPIVPFWDNIEALRDQAKRNPKLQGLLDHIMATTGGTAARPSSGRTERVITQPDKTTDRQLDAIRRYRRVDAGMGILRRTEPLHFAILHHAFLPKRTDPELEREFGQLVDIVTRLERVTNSHAMAMAREPEKSRVTLDTWLLRRIEKKDAVVGLALGDAEEMAIAAVRAFEAVTEPPFDVKEDQKAADEPKPRAPRQSGGIPFMPDHSEPEVA